MAAKKVMGGGSSWPEIFKSNSTDHSPTKTPLSASPSPAPPPFSASPLLATIQQATYPAACTEVPGPCCIYKAATHAPLLSTINPASTTTAQPQPEAAAPPQGNKKHTEGKHPPPATMPKRRQLGIVALTSRVKTPAAIFIRTSGIKLLLLKRRLWRRLLRRGSSILRLGLGRGQRRFSYAYYRQFEYEFSPSSTPLFGPSRGVTAASRTKKLCGGSRLLYCLLCGAAGATLDDGSYEDQLFRLEVAVLSERGDHKDAKELEVQEPGDLWVYSEEEDDDDDEQGEEQEEQESGNEDSVDNRAEKFIERFYENIRIQRQESIEQWQEMLQRSC